MYLNLYNLLHYLQGHVFIIYILMYFECLLEITWLLIISETKSIVKKNVYKKVIPAQ